MLLLLAALSGRLFLSRLFSAGVSSNDVAGTQIVLLKSRCFCVVLIALGHFVGRVGLEVVFSRFFWMVLLGFR
jgi:hypothetical protein